MKKLLMLVLTGLFAGFKAKQVISDTDAVHHIKQFKEAITELAGGPKRSYLKEMVGYEACEGEVAFIDGAKPANAAGADNAMADVTGRYSYDQITTPTATQLADSVLTRNDDVEGQRTAVVPREIVIGKWFQPSEKNFLQYTDPTSTKMRQLMAGYWRKEDMRIIHAMFADEQDRVAYDATDSTTITAEAYPTSQVLDDAGYDVIDIKIFSEIKAKFLTQYLMGENIYACFGPTTWKALVDNSGDKLTNQDYVSSAKNFESGDLPTVYGVVPVVHPLFDDTTTLTAAGLVSGDELGLISAWSEDGICWSEFMGQQSLMDGPLAAFKGQYVAQVQEFANACRNDDLQTCQGAIFATPPTP